MSDIYTLQSTDLINQTFDDINDNFTKLNTDKADKVVGLQQFASTTSDQLNSVISDSLGEGSLLFGNALDFYKYSIVTSVASGNLTVALKNFEGNDPTATKPVKIQIGGVIRTITSGTSLSPSGDGSSQIKSGTNWFNLGSAELATKETDLFLYLVYDTTLGKIGTLVSRIPYGNTIADFSATGTNEKARVTSPNINPISTDPVVNIGRFNATLSAGGAYTWSIPATSVIINSPIYETRDNDFIPQLSAGGSMTFTSTGISLAKYRISGDNILVSLVFNGTIGGTLSRNIVSTLPFNSKNGVNIYRGINVREDAAANALAGEYYLPANSTIIYRPLSLANHTSGGTTFYNTFNFTI